MVSIGPRKDVSDAVAREGGQLADAQTVSALIDTGATRTIVQEEVLKDIGLSPVGKVHMVTAATRDHLCFEYTAILWLPQGLKFDVVVLGAPLVGTEYQCLIGRDILQHGILIYSGFDNSFTLSI